MDKRTPTPPNVLNPRSTPRRVLDITTDAKLQSTLSNRGSASASEYLSGVLVDDVSPSILADLQDHATCTAENLLNGLLSLCLPEEYKCNAPADLLDQCLNAVLPICNAQDHQVKTKGKQKRTDEEALADSLGIHTYLIEYCQAKSNEMESYKPFVYAFNHALRALHKIDVPLRKSTDQLLLFHRNDPKLIAATHNGHTSQRKPDVLLVSLEVAQNAFSDGDPGSWADHALKTAGEPPRNNFQWSGSLSAGEFKRTKSTLPSPPAEYTVKPAKNIPPQPFPSTLDETSEDLSTQQERTQPSEETSPQLLNNPVEQPSEFRRSERLALQPNVPRKVLVFGTSSSRKRKNECVEKSSSKRVKTQLVPSKRPPAMLQSALYAAERMSHAIWISHTINLVIIDDVAYIWWYDNEGAIQSHGINFVQDLPHFLVLLLCFERFTPRDWGIIPTFIFAEKETDHCLLSFPSSPSVSTVDININHADKIRDHFGIVGRATQMLPATSQSKDPRDISRNLGDMDLVVKVYWPEASRAREGQIIEKARQIAKRNDAVDGHLPDLICSHDLEEYSTKRVRIAFGIATESHRVLRVMLFRRLYPITDLIDDKFWKAFWECFRCHYYLWVGGVEHNDISVRNLMYDKLNEDRGILNDYDLAHLRGQPRPSGTERTGTMPFMALDLLTNDAWNGKIARLYRHDCESFAWVLLWISCRYENEKHATISKLKDIAATPSYEKSWDASVSLVTLFVSQRYQRELNALRRDGSPSEQGTDEIVQSCQKALEGRGVCINLLDSWHHN